jgi:hypothetical protein
VSRREIPGAVLAVCADMISSGETHATLDGLFMYAGAPGDPPEGSKHAKALAWLRRTNKDPSVDPLSVLGRLIETYMERPVDESPGSWDKWLVPVRSKLAAALAASGLQYIQGGRVVGSLGAPTRTLQEFIRSRDIIAINHEFERASKNVDADPREAVSAASNILESVCKVYIEDEKLGMPAKQDLQSVWTVVRKSLGFDPSQVEDQDLQQILTGMLSIVHGIGALRTHASSAHGSGRKRYKLEPRHARLAIHAAHTMVLFVLESWQTKNAAKASG